MQIKISDAHIQKATETTKSLAPNTVLFLLKSGPVFLRVMYSVTEKANSILAK